jgi:glycine/D-amino acid oxidase-like deaminating enzyme
MESTQKQNFINNSPWLHQLNRTRPVIKIDYDHETDVAIVGGGIAGVVTAFYALKNTKKQITLIEADKIAHGATGHNGGFLASYFERTFSSLVQEFGLEMAAEAQKEMETAWTLLDEIRIEAQLQTPMWQFTGYAACSTFDELLVHLRNNALRTKAHITPSMIMVSEEAKFISEIPSMYKDLYTVLPKKDILSLLETDDESYVGILTTRKGCMNSAMFTEELVGFLLSKYPDRFKLAEHTPVRRLVLKRSHAILDIYKSKKIVAKKVVLATNGFENINIVNIGGPSINSKFHYLVRGIVGYMAGYTEEMNKPPTQISYLPLNAQHGIDIFREEPYFYLTRRPYEAEKKETHNLICVGGPESLMDDTNNYKREHPYAAEAKASIDKFLKHTYKHTPKDNMEYKFLWHGLMGFTPNGVRLIGPEPINPILLYNLGCNGVGLLPSIYGGEKISKFLQNKRLKSSIFDPKQQVIYAT